MSSTAADDRFEIIYPRGRGWSRAWVAYLVPVLTPASWLYQGVTGAVRNTRDLDAGPPPPGVKVISVGNLEVGGSGKTPLAMYLLERIAAGGGTPVYVSRAFGGVAGKLQAVTVVAPEGAVAPLQPGARFLYRRGSRRNLAREIGDEGAVVADRVPGAALLFSRHKTKALDYAVRRLGATHVVLDDAFQSWGVPRDVDVVLVDAGVPLRGARLLPAGPFRELPEALKRADILGISGVDNAEGLDEAAERIFAFLSLRAGKQKPYFGLCKEVDIVDARTGASVRLEGGVIAVSGIGRPESFDSSLRRCGIGISASLRYPDHHRYGPRDVDAIREVCRRHGTARVAVSEKDWVKIRELGCEDLDIVVARLRLKITGEHPLAGLAQKKAAD